MIILRRYKSFIGKKFRVNGLTCVSQFEALKVYKIGCLDRILRFLQLRPCSILRIYNYANELRRCTVANVR
jgi:hypothetical protein